MKNIFSKTEFSQTLEKIFFFIFLRRSNWRSICFVIKPRIALLSILCSPNRIFLDSKPDEMIHTRLMLCVFYTRAVGPTV